ncbi:MAG: PilN domain-containing protein [Nitrosomonadales bacterium]|nr:PilN domain-containing protein [Nitrosomonadales bacterium]
MMRINLLPHRAQKRKARQVQFAAFSVISLLLGAVAVGFVHTYISAEISYQERRNQYLKQEIEVLNKQIAEINKLREQTESLLSRKTVVENLQTTRSDVVHLMDQMLRILPDGVYLKSLKQTGSKISLVGYAQSNARVSTLMRAIDNSPWLELPALVEIHAATANGARVSEFTLNFSLKKQAPATPAATAKPAATKG